MFPPHVDVFTCLYELDWGMGRRFRLEQPGDRRKGSIRNRAIQMKESKSKQKASLQGMRESKKVCDHFNKSGHADPASSLHPHFRDHLNFSACVHGPVHAVSQMQPPPEHWPFSEQSRLDWHFAGH